MKTLKMMSYILTKREKLGFFGLFIGMLINSLLEIFGLAILVPVVQLVAYPEQTIAESWYMRIFVNTLKIPEGETKLLLVAVVALISIVYIVKAIYFVVFTFWQHSFINGFSRRLSTELFANYLYQPYEFHVYHNTSELISRATHDVGAFVDGMNMIMSTLSDVLFCAMTFAYLLLNEWAMTLVIFAGLGMLSVFLNWLFRKKARTYGKEAALLNVVTLKAVREGLAGIKETKIANREAFFVEAYDAARKKAQDIYVRTDVIGVIPRTAVEAMGMVGMLLSLLVFYLLGNSPERIVGTFTLLALAVTKLLPYISRIAGRLNSFRFAIWSIHKVNEDIHLIREIPAVIGDSLDARPMAFETCVELKDVTFKYKGGTAPVLNKVSVTISKGKSVAFCGRSGAGKTTTVDILLGLLKPQNGAVLCDGVDVSSNLSGWHKNLSYVPQDIYMVDDTIRANVAFGFSREEICDDRIWDSLEKAHLADYVRGLPRQLDSLIGEKGVRLSGGQRQRIGIARALYRDTPIIVFDEATSALDFETEGEILEAVEGLRGEKTLVIITHRLNTIANCDVIYQISDASIVCTKNEA